MNVNKVSFDAVPSFHDFEIIGIRFDSHSAVEIALREESTNKRVLIALSGIVGFKGDLLLHQNVVQDFFIIDWLSGNLEGWITDCKDKLAGQIPQNLFALSAERVRAGSLFLAVLKSSIGFEFTSFFEKIEIF
ncbi:hypothetical protein [Burkholderia sp. PAMC 26561]|uniref:hypothetical protein n=1 Tax=Burkholderia sp. PAMC 26561 TaxID=1795043 RepID=UPI00076B4DCA|nr:hypothetical protein [Burkholderia sp. PAMC 26561]AME28673.1 hypothetical protein AXG89_33335 [Burkholderia sp. PAMC 26561]